MEPDDTEIRTAALNYFFESKHSDKADKAREIFLLVYREEIESTYVGMRKVWDSLKAKNPTMKLE